MASLYGIGAALQEGIRGYDAGMAAGDANRARDEQIIAAKNSNRLNAARTERELQDFDSADTFKSAFNESLQTSRDPDFSEATNFNRAGLLAAQKLGNPTLIEKYTLAHDSSAKQDIFKESVGVLNDAKNATGPMDFSRVNEMTKRVGLPLEIQSVTGDQVVVKGKLGIKTYNIQGYINELARALNPSAAYGNVQAQVSNEVALARSDADRQRVAAERESIAARNEAAKIAAFERQRAMNQDRLNAQERISRDRLQAQERMNAERIKARTPVEVPAGGPFNTDVVDGGAASAKDLFTAYTDRGVSMADAAARLKAMGYSREEVAAALGIQ